MDNEPRNAEGFPSLPAIDARATTLLRRRATRAENFSRIGTRLLEVLCTILHVACVVFYVLEKAWIYVGPFIVLLMFDIYAIIKVWLISTGARGRFWERSFDRCMVGLPVAVINFYCLFDFSGCAWVLRDVDRLGLQITLSLSGALSLLSLGIAALEIDYSANSSVAREVDKSMWYTLRHLAFRISEVTWRVLFYVLYALLTRPLIARGVGNSTATAFLVTLPLFVIWFIYFVLIMWACRIPGMPKEQLVPAIVVAYVAMGPNPAIYMLDTPYHHRTARRANLCFTASRCVEILALGVFACVSQHVNYPDSCAHDIVVVTYVLHTSTWLIVLLLGSAIVNAALFFSSPRMVQRLFCARGGSQTVPFMPNSNGARWDISDTPSVCFATFLVNQGSGSGVLANVVPMSSVNPNVFRVEAELGQGSYGLVVRVRQDIHGAEPRKFALKLQSTGEGRNRMDKQQSPMRSPYTLAMRERDIYRRIWEEVDSTTGRLGHPFIVRLLCYSDWPREMELFYENSGEPVQFISVRNGKAQAVTKFDTALVMEFCEQGSLEEYVPAHLRSDPARDQDVRSGTHYLDTVRRFIAEILLALDFLHSSKSVIYRDLKLDNVFVCVDKYGKSHVKLGDFGFSKVVSEMDQPTSVAGSPYFAAPEMIAMQKKMSRGNTDWSLDVFSLGMVMFILLHGSVCETGRKRWEMPHHWRGSRMTHPSQGEMKFSAALSRLARTTRGVPSVIELIVRATQSKPESRPTVKQMMASPFFQDIHSEAGVSLPAVDWMAVRLTDI